MKKLFPVVATCCIVLLAYCVRPPDYPKEPSIAYLRMSKDTLKQGQGYADSLFVTFSFTDGDGDLGFPENDRTPSVFIIDARDSFPKDSLQLPYVEPQGAGNGISGEITIKLPTTCCIYIDPLNPLSPYACEEVTQVQYNKLVYYIKIRDRAGHESNQIKTDTISLQCY